MGSEIRRMFLGKGFWMGLAVAMAGIVFGAAYPKIEGLLDTGKFVNMEAEALKSQAMIFFASSGCCSSLERFFPSGTSGRLSEICASENREAGLCGEQSVYSSSGRISGSIPGRHADVFYIFCSVFPFGGTGKVSLEFCVGAYRDSFTLRDAGRHHQYFRGNLRSPDRLRVSGFWPAFCVLLFLCDIKGQIL